MATLLQNLPGYREIAGALHSNKTPVLANGLAAIHKAQFIHALCGELARGALVLTADEAAAMRMAEDLCRFAGEEIALAYPEREFTYQAVESVSREYEQQRLGILRRLQQQPQLIVVASVTAALQPTVPPERLRQSILTLTPGQEYPPERLLHFLVEAGYQRADQVEGVGQFSSRGGIVDFYPPQYAWPVRLEYWGDEIDTLAAFSAETQRREDTLKSVDITPVRELLYESDVLLAELRRQHEKLSPRQRETCGETLLHDCELLENGCLLPAADRYLGAIYPQSGSLTAFRGDRLLFLCEGVSLREALSHAAWQQKEDCRVLLEEGVLMPGGGFFYPEPQELMEELAALPTVILDSFPRSYSGLSLGALTAVQANTLSVWSGQMDSLTEDLQNYREDGWCLHLLGGTERGSAALADDLQKRGFNARYVKSVNDITPGTISVLPGGLSAGFEYPELRWAVITCARGAAASPLSGVRRRKKQNGAVIRDIADLSPGDLVVHSAHGIGIFEGIIKKEVQGVTKDYIKLRYAGTDTLFVPVTQLDLVSKYIGGREDENVRLSKLNSGEWNKTRQRVKKAVEDMAGELIRLYAQRLTAKGFAFSPDSDWQQEFEQKFEYEDTGDQLRCAAEIKHDMEQTAPMERLLCGDVGFGKTEVALRAVFKCVLDGKQCAVMVPTTILAWQHYQTFLRRLEGYPMKVELLSRFRTPKQQKEILAGLADGKIDVVVGTHRLVQNDVRFKDLGLCIIDEEQRFGVKHKEKMKELKGSVDVLTLSATPIPRTLNMAMSGIRDMSVINEAPMDRHPVQTYVLEYSDTIIMEAMRKELRRGGQVFYLHNRIDDIDLAAARLREALPDARIVTAHGRMNEEELSAIWQKLLEREIDILVCTTIIEAGIDVPNCNTLIIEDADRMGLSQLYQLRGRVGRSQRRAYAYFTFRRGKALSEISEKRLEAIREFTSFGSGFRIAMRDLEIRGAGSILGSQQHGQMEAVGYDLYLKLLGDAIREQKGEPPVEALECLVDIQIEAHIPEKYIPALAQRIDIYKKIAAIATEEDYSDTMDELIDRYGDPPASVVGLLDVALIRGRASHLGIHEIDQRTTNLLFYGDRYDRNTLVALSVAMPGRFMMSTGAKSYLTIRMQRGQAPLDCIRETLSALEKARDSANIS